MLRIGGVAIRTQADGAVRHVKRRGNRQPSPALVCTPVSELQNLGLQGASTRNLLTLVQPSTWATGPRSIGRLPGMARRIHSALRRPVVALRTLHAVQGQEAVLRSPQGGLMLEPDPSGIGSGST